MSAPEYRLAAEVRPDQAGPPAAVLSASGYRPADAVPPAAPGGLRGLYRRQFRASRQEEPQAGPADFLARRARFDEDYWAIELDIADPERFIAETTSAG